MGLWKNIHCVPSYYEESWQWFYIREISKNPEGQLITTDLSNEPPVEITLNEDDSALYLVNMPLPSDNYLIPTIIELNSDTEISYYIKDIAYYVNGILFQEDSSFNLNMQYDSTADRYDGILEWIILDEKITIEFILLPSGERDPRQPE